MREYCIFLLSQLLRATAEYDTSGPNTFFRHVMSDHPPTKTPLLNSRNYAKARLRLDFP